MTIEEQAVVEGTEGSAKPEPKGSDARDDDLESLLAEYDKEVEPRSKSEPEPKEEKAHDTSALEKRLNDLQSTIATERYRTDMASTIKDIRGDLDPEIFDETLVESWIDAEARRDPRLQRAWENRNANPKQFQRVKAELGNKFRERFSKLPDRQATEDREAVSAAVRGASNKAPEGKAPDYSGMSNQEYREAVKKEHGFDPGV